MPITGKLLADFSDFDNAVKKSEAELRGFEQAAGRVGVSLDEMASPSAGQALSVLHQNLGQVDRMLGAVGIHIGPALGALGELGTIAGKTAADLGLLATAGAAFGVGYASFQITRAVTEFFQLDDAIASATSKLFGLADTTATAAYKTDLLARASAEAKREITDLAEAERVLTAASRAQQESLQTASSRAERYSDHLKNLKTDMDNVSIVQAELIRLGHLYGESVDAIAKSLGLQAAAVQHVLDLDKQEADRLKEKEKQAKAYRDFVNSVEEQRIKDEEARQKREEQLDKDYRASRNEIGIRMMEDEAARMKVEELAKAEHLKVMLGLDAAYLQQTAALAQSIAASGTGIWTGTMPIAPGGNVWTSGMEIPAMGNVWTSPPPIFEGGVGASGETTTVNMNGLLLTSDPSAREALRKVVDDVLVSGAKRSRKLSF